MAYRSIDADNVVATIERLRRRIEERFPARGLAAVCAELRDVALKDIERVARLRRPYLFIRIGVCAIAVLLAGSLLYLITEVKLPNLLELLRPEPGQGAMLNLFQGLDSAVNIIILFGVFLFFLLRHEEREKRRLALADLYELRAIAHVIDMHQLTKDPVAMLSGHARTASSPKDQMSAFELARYLDYCSEMLSLVAKVAALYAQGMRDEVVIATVSDLEAMTTNLSRKIWQKIVLVEQMQPGRAD